MEALLLWPSVCLVEVPWGSWEWLRGHASGRSFLPVIVQLVQLVRWRPGSQSPVWEGGQGRAGGAIPRLFALGRREPLPEGRGCFFWEWAMVATLVAGSFVEDTVLAKHCEAGGDIVGFWGDLPDRTKIGSWIQYPL